MGRRSWIVTTGVSLVTVVALVKEGSRRRLKSRVDQQNYLADCLVNHHFQDDLEKLIYSVLHNHKSRAADAHRLMISLRSVMAIGDDSTLREVKRKIFECQDKHPELEIIFDEKQRRIHIYPRSFSKQA